MSSSGKAPADAEASSPRHQPPSDDQEAPSPTSTVHQPKQPGTPLRSPQVSPAPPISISTTTSIDLKQALELGPEDSQEISANRPSLLSPPSHCGSSQSPVTSPSNTSRRPSTRSRIVRHIRRISSPKPVTSIPEDDNRRAAEINAPAGSRNNTREFPIPGSSEDGVKASGVQHTLDKASAKAWKAKFRATEEKEKLSSQAFEGFNTGKDTAPLPARPRSKSIRRGANIVEPEPWEKDFDAGTAFQEPKEWLRAQGLDPKDEPPPSPRPRPYDGELEDGDWDIPAIEAKMNSNFFDPNMNPNAARQAPNAAQAQQMNGINGGQHWPNVGAQADMNVLWEYIQNLSQMHEGIRQQTQHVLNGVQQIQARAAGDDGNIPHVNGFPNGGSQSQVAEIARLQNELSASNNKVDELSTFVAKLQGINIDYEAAMAHLMDKLRPFAQQHSQALLSQKAHYLRLIEEERKENLELRLQQTRMQESASRINEELKLGLKALTEVELPYIRKIAALKADNKALRRICGVPLMDDSDNDADDEEEVAETKENANGVVQVESPEPIRPVPRDVLLASMG